MGFLLNNLFTVWILDVFNKISLILDGFVYTLAGWLFNTFLDLCKWNITTELGDFQVVIDRIKVFIGILALFVLIKSLLEFMADPEKLSANGESIVKNVVISFALLIIFPFIFEVLNGFQIAVVENDTIMRLVLNENMIEASENEDGSFWTMNNSGNVFMNNVFLLFFRYDNKVGFMDVVSSVLAGGPVSIFLDLSDSKFDTISDAIDAVQRGAPILGLLPFSNSAYIEYQYPIISTIVGLVFCYYFIQLAIGVGIRIFKLFVLQIVAPFPIIMNINPSTQGFLKKYITYLTSTYIDIFVRMLVVMLIYPTIGFILDKINTESSGNLVLNLILIIAMLKFAKEFPKMISDLFGLDISSGGKSPKGFLGGLFGGAFALGASAITGHKAGLRGKDLAGHIASNTWKGGVAGRAGLKNGLTAFGKSTLGSVANSYASASQIKRSGSYSNYAKGKMLQQVGYDKYDAGETERLSDAVKVAEANKNKFNDYLSKVNNLKSNSQDYFAKAMMQSNDQQIKNMGVEYARNLAIVRSNGAGVSLSEFQNAMNYVSGKELALERFYNGQSGLNGTAAYAELNSLKSSIAKEVQDVNYTVHGVSQSVGNLIGTFGDLNTAAAELNNKYIEADKNFDAAQAANKAYTSSDIHKLVNMQAPKNKK